MRVSEVLRICTEYRGDGTEISRRYPGYFHGLCTFFRELGDVGEFFFEVREVFLHFLVRFLEFFHLLACMEGGGVVASAEEAPDAGKWHGEFFAQEVHRHLASLGNFFFSSFLLEVLEGNAVEFRNGIENVLLAYCLLFAAGDGVFENGLGILERDGGEILKLLYGAEAIKRSFEFTDILNEVFGDVDKDIIREEKVAFHGFFSKDGNARFLVRAANVGNHPSFEARAKPIFEGGDILGRPVAGDDDLFVFLVEGVENMEKLVLRLLFSGEKLYIIDDEEINGAVAVFELIDCAILDRGNQFLGEFLACGVEDAFFGVFGKDVVAHGLEEVGFAESHAAIEEEGIVGFTEIAAYREACRMSEIVVASHNEIREGVAGVEIGFLCGRGRGCSAFERRG